MSQIREESPGNAYGSSSNKYDGHVADDDDLMNKKNGSKFVEEAFVQKSSMYYDANHHQGEIMDGGSEDDLDLVFDDQEEGGGVTESERINFRKRHKQHLKDERTAFNRFRLGCGKIVNNEIVQIGMIVLIIINAIIMGIATFDFVTDDPTTEALFSNIDRGFLVIYTIELGMQFVYFGWHLIQDAWLVFDLVVVVASWAFDAEAAVSDGNSLGNQFQIIRAFRIFRAFRLITRIKVLRDLVAAIGEVIPRMTAIGMLLILIFYIFAVLFTELFRDLELSDTYFKTLDGSLFTCYEMMTLEWAGVAREVMKQRSWAWAPFLAFIAITGFMVFNLIIAVICDAVSIIDKIAREREAKARGITLESPEEKLLYAQQRMDVLGHRVDEMLKTQKEMQDMLELLASELYRLDSSLPKKFDNRNKDESI